MSTQIERLTSILQIDELKLHQAAAVREAISSSQVLEGTCKLLLAVRGVVSAMEEMEGVSDEETAQAALKLIGKVEKVRAEIRGRIPSRTRSLDIIRRVLGSSEMQPDNLAVLEEWGVYSMLSVEDYSDCQLADLASRLQL